MNRELKHGRLVDPAAGFLPGRGLVTETTGDQTDQNNKKYLQILPKNHTCPFNSFKQRISGYLDISQQRIGISGYQVKNVGVIYCSSSSLLSIVYNHLSHG